MTEPLSDALGVEETLSDAEGLVSALIEASAAVRVPPLDALAAGDDVAPEALAAAVTAVLPLAPAVPDCDALRVTKPVAEALAEAHALAHAVVIGDAVELAHSVATSLPDAPDGLAEPLTLSLGEPLALPAPPESVGFREGGRVASADIDGLPDALPLSLALPLGDASSDAVAADAVAAAVAEAGPERVAVAERAPLPLRVAAPVAVGEAVAERGAVALGVLLPPAVDTLGAPLAEPQGDGERDDETLAVSLTAAVGLEDDEALALADALTDAAVLVVGVTERDVRAPVMDAQSDGDDAAVSVTVSLALTLPKSGDGDESDDALSAALGDALCVASVLSLTDADGEDEGDGCGDADSDADPLAVALADCDAVLVAEPAEDRDGEGDALRCADADSELDEDAASDGADDALTLCDGDGVGVALALSVADPAALALALAAPLALMLPPALAEALALALAAALSLAEAVGDAALDGVAALAVAAAERAAEGDAPALAVAPRGAEPVGALLTEADLLGDVVDDVLALALALGESLPLALCVSLALARAEPLIDGESLGVVSTERDSDARSEEEPDRVGLRGVAVIDAVRGGVAEAPPLALPAPPACAAEKDGEPLALGAPLLLAETVGDGDRRADALSDAEPLVERVAPADDDGEGLALGDAVADAELRGEREGGAERERDAGAVAERDAGALPLPDEEPLVDKEARGDCDSGLAEKAPESDGDPELVRRAVTAAVPLDVAAAPVADPRAEPLAGATLALADSERRERALVLAAPDAAGETDGAPLAEVSGDALPEGA